MIGHVTTVCNSCARYSEGLRNEQCLKTQDLPPPFIEAKDRATDKTSKMLKTKNSKNAVSTAEGNIKYYKVDI